MIVYSTTLQSGDSEEGSTSISSGEEDRKFNALPLTDKPHHGDDDDDGEEMDAGDEMMKLKKEEDDDKNDFDV